MVKAACQPICAVGSGPNAALPDNALQHAHERCSAPAIAFHDKLIRPEGLDRAHGLLVQDALILGTVDFQCYGFSLNGPGPPDRTRDILTKSVADESALSHLRYELSVGAERDCLVHVSDCALPLSDDLCRVVALGDRCSVRRALRKTQCEQQRDARQSNGAHNVRHFGCAICPSQPPCYRASLRPWPRAPPHGTCGGCPRCPRAWAAAASPSHPSYRR